MCGRKGAPFRGGFVRGCPCFSRFQMKLRRKDNAGFATRENEFHPRYKGGAAQGIAADGGLFVPESFLQIDLEEMKYAAHEYDILCSARIAVFLLIWTRRPLRRSPSRHTGCSTTRAGRAHKELTSVDYVMELYAWTDARI